LIKDSGLKGWNLFIGVLPLFFVGVFVCLTWARIISELGRLIGWQYEQLREMEKKLKSSYKMHNKEWEKFYQPAKSGKEFSFSNLESKLPLLFISLYALYAIGLIIAASIGIF
jgi:hypothetical protein